MKGQERVVKLMANIRWGSHNTKGGIIKRERK